MAEEIVVLRAAWTGLDPGAVVFYYLGDERSDERSEEEASRAKERVIMKLETQNVLLSITPDVPLLYRVVGVSPLLP